jgi:hypothetical protein
MQTAASTTISTHPKDLVMAAAKEIIKKRGHPFVWAPTDGDPSILKTPHMDLFEMSAVEFYSILRLKIKLHGMD